MTEREALKLALEALEFMSHVDSIFANEFDFQINAIKEALAQPEQDWSMLQAMQGSLREHMAKIKELESQRKPLTDEGISDLWCKVSNTDFVTADTHVFARAIEAAHGIKENT